MSVELSEATPASVNQSIELQADIPSQEAEVSEEDLKKKIALYYHSLVRP